MPTRMSGGAAAAAVVLVALGLAGCTFGDDAPDPTSSSSTVAPGVEPTDKGGTTPKPDPADAVIDRKSVV